MILGISTSLSRFSIAICDGENILYQQQEERASAGRTNLHGMVNVGLANVGITAQDLTAIAVDIGPGGTSSVRTGVAFGNALAYSLNIPIAGVSSAVLMGMSLKKQYADRTAAILYKSIKGHYYCGIFENGKVEFTYAKLPEIASMIDDQYKKIAFAGNSEVQEALIGKLSTTEALATDIHKVGTDALGSYCGIAKADLKHYPELPTPLNEANLV